MKYSKKTVNKVLIWGGGLLILIIMLYVLNKYFGKEYFKIKCNSGKKLIHGKCQSVTKTATKVAPVASVAPVAPVDPINKNCKEAIAKGALASESPPYDLSKCLPEKCTTNNCDDLCLNGLGVYYENPKYYGLPGCYHFEVGDGAY